MKIFAYRTTMPFSNDLFSRGPSLSPPTQKSVIPTNNVPSILDVLNGAISIRDIYPGAGGDWSSGEDVSKNYRDTGDDYKRLERDFDILNNLTNQAPVQQEKWRVKVPGGSKTFSSFQLAQKYKEQLRDKGILKVYLSRIAQKQEVSHDRIELITDSLAKTVMVESVDANRGVKENGAAFCVATGHFITCAHVIKKYNKYEASKDTNLSGGVIVSLIYGGQRYRATVVATDPLLDLALLKSNLNIPSFQLDVSMSIGEEIIAIGSPYGFENNVSIGHIGSLNRRVYFYAGAPLYSFVDLAIFPGNSGGPVIKESSGKVVGMVTLIVSAEGNYGLNASLPAKYIQSFCSAHIKNFVVSKE